MTRYRLMLSMSGSMLSDVCSTWGRSFVLAERIRQLSGDLDVVSGDLRGDSGCFRAILVRSRATGIQCGQRWADTGLFGRHRPKVGRCLRMLGNSDPLWAVSADVQTSPPRCDNAAPAIHEPWPASTAEFGLCPDQPPPRIGYRCGPASSGAAVSAGDDPSGPSPAKS